ncbi:hypothetical protein R1sor_017605 [Riccia sorocarpa]|uniref:DUF4283 domain-containing protein n=1 Tax=Riccia sorocarpa TaxID=122646 RepID=A0ABD3I7B7_9MARC
MGSGGKSRKPVSSKGTVVPGSNAPASGRSNAGSGSQKGVSNQDPGESKNAVCTLGASVVKLNESMSQNTGNLAPGQSNHQSQSGAKTSSTNQQNDSTWSAPSLVTLQQNWEMIPVDPLLQLSSSIGASQRSIPDEPADIDDVMSQGEEENETENDNESSNSIALTQRRNRMRTIRKLKKAKTIWFTPDDLCSRMTPVWVELRDVKTCLMDFALEMLQMVGPVLYAAKKVGTGKSNIIRGCVMVDLNQELRDVVKVVVPEAPDRIMKQAIRYTKLPDDEEEDKEDPMEQDNTANGGQQRTNNTSHQGNKSGGQTMIPANNVNTQGDQLTGLKHSIDSPDRRLSLA